jgi:hypothetical protein
MMDSNGNIKNKYKIKKIYEDSIKLWKDGDNPYTYSRINSIKHNNKIDNI